MGTDSLECWELCVSGFRCCMSMHCVCPTPECLPCTTSPSPTIRSAPIRGRLGTPVMYAVMHTVQPLRQARRSTVPSKEWMGVVLPHFGSFCRGSTGVFGRCSARNFRVMMVQREFGSTSASSGLSLLARFMICTVPKRGDADGVTGD